MVWSGLFAMSVYLVLSENFFVYFDLATLRVKIRVMIVERQQISPDKRFCEKIGIFLVMPRCHVSALNSS